MVIGGWKFELGKIWADNDWDAPLPLLGLKWGATEIVPKKNCRPRYLLDFVRHRTHSKLKWVTITWLRIEYNLNFEKVIRVYSKEELLEP